MDGTILLILLLSIAPVVLQIMALNIFCQRIDLVQIQPCAPFQQAYHGAPI
jgi:hypothetical protein